MVSPFKPLVFTKHAEDALFERALDRSWIEHTVRNPEWITADPGRPGIQRLFRTIPQNEHRVLRVAIFETRTEIRIVTVFFDRDAKRMR